MGLGETRGDLLLSGCVLPLCGCRSFPAGEVMWGDGSRLMLAPPLTRREWNPKTDKHLPVNYDITDFEAGKRACKMKLQVGACDLAA